jgi:hypothetical protein
MVTHDLADARRSALDDRVDAFGWGLLFVALGAVGLVPGLPQDAWLVAAGAVMLGIGAVRAVLGLRINRLTTAVGIVALVVGIGGVVELGAATWPLALVVLGVAMLADAAAHRGAAAPGAVRDGR